MFGYSQIPIAVKWIAGVLIAGFIAQFGRMLAEYLVRRSRMRRITCGNSDVQDVKKTGQDELQHDDEAVSSKTRKKQLKAMQKLRKKMR